jgi:AraC-like DNA-binding protein
MKNNGASPCASDGRYRQLVVQAENLALSDVNKAVQISALCRALAVHQHTLRKAFNKIHGLPPCRHLRMLRMTQARQALLSADCEPATVTEVATCFGFMELGRFSVDYRQAFGESPSQTLYRACQTRRQTGPESVNSASW